MKKSQFVLSRKNQQGQVAIFVALIFQILFVFFAILINVGLLVHHKINLQQSADLAAYYGALKQAESLNAIAHINFQIRQAWKLLAWRYRIVGTFGFQRTSGGSTTQPVFPITLNYGGVPSVINSAKDVDDGSCPAGTELVNTATHPFFCISHGGILGWTGASAERASAENGCKINCTLMTTAVPYTVNAIPNLSVVIDNSTSAAISTAIAEVNNNLEGLCKSVGKINMNLLAKMIVSYRRETLMRSQTLLMLAGNLSQDKFLDLDGNEVVKGVTNTFKNNLTEANLDSGTNLILKTYNSLSDSSCAMRSDMSQAGNKAEAGEFLKRIEFNLIEFFIHDCSWTAGTLPTQAAGQNFRSGRIYNAGLTDLSDGSFVGTNPTPKLDTAVTQNIRNEIMQLVQLENNKYTVGYEKNPWCPAYYVVSASSEPMIPFLPIVKIKLNAKAVAKPFGGTIGPWYGRKWDRAAKNTQDGITFADQNLQLDENLPVATNMGGVAVSKTQFARLLPNFSRYVGDPKGLSDPDYIAEYHAALINRRPNSNPVSFSTTKSPDPGAVNQTLSSPGAWPALTSWDNAFDIASADYDPLTKEPSNRDSYFRDLEISAIAPNQFDLSYYSIEPDFYNNYYTRLSNPDIFSKLKNSAQMGPDTVNFVRPDFGHSRTVYYNKPDFSVRNQQEIVKKTLGTNGSGLAGSKSNMLEAFPYLATNQASLLTGWTFKNFTDFEAFPKDDVNTPDGTMAFARCRDTWQNENGGPGYGSPVDSPPLPPTPGNCVTGGRVGYSVKLVSPSLLRETSPDQPLGGPGTAGKILNPIPADLLN